MGYKIYSQKLSISSSDYSWRRTRNRQHQQYESPGVPIIEGIHRPSRRSRIYVDEENESQYGSDRDDISTIYE